MALVNDKPCKIYVLSRFDLNGTAALVPSNKGVPVISVARWPSSQYSMDHWLRLALKHHPYRVHDPKEADLVYWDSSVNYLCSQQLRGIQLQLAWLNRTMPPPRRLPTWTTAVWSGCAHRIGEHGRHLFLIREDRAPSSRRHLVTPFVVHHEAVVRGRSRHNARSSGSNPSPTSKPGIKHAPGLLLFAGHVPKAMISNVRILLWQQLVLDRRATVLSSTVYCAHGPFADCHRPPSFWKNFSAAYFEHQCKPFCEGTAWPGNCKHIAARPTVEKSRHVYRQKCHAYTTDAQLAAAGDGVMLQQADFDRMRSMQARGRMSESDYYDYMFNHTFCLVAPGDFVGTRKLAEAVAVGAAGGCIPVIVVPPAASQTLPYLRWLDYCRGAILVSLQTARTQFARVVDHLETVDVASKRSYLAQVSRGFTVTGSSTIDAPSTAEFLINEICWVTLHEGGPTAAIEIMSTDHDTPSCVL